MASLEIEGKLIQKLAVQRGTSARGEWSKQEFLIEYKEGNFPSNACFSVWGADKVRDLENFQIGSQIRVSFNINSREYNGRWYTDLRAWRIAPAAAEAPQQPAYAPQQNNSVPAGFGPSAAPAAAPAPTAADIPGDSSDDLPF